jgi:hypothetical protein
MPIVTYFYAVLLEERILPQSLSGADSSASCNIQ